MVAPFVIQAQCFKSAILSLPLAKDLPGMCQMSSGCPGFWACLDGVKSHATAFQFETSREVRQHKAQDDKLWVIAGSEEDI